MHTSKKLKISLVHGKRGQPYFGKDAMGLRRSVQSFWQRISFCLAIITQEVIFERVITKFFMFLEKKINSLVIRVKTLIIFLKLSEQSRAKMAERKRQNFLICCQFRNHKVPIAQIKSSRSILHLRKCFFQQAEAISI